MTFQHLTLAGNSQVRFDNFQQVVKSGKQSGGLRFDNFRKVVKSGKQSGGLRVDNFQQVVKSGVVKTNRHQEYQD